MKGYIFLLLVCTLTIRVQAQKKSKIKEKTSYYTDVYQVNKKNKEVRNGYFIRRNKSGINEVKGEYKDNVRVGIWEFHDMKNILDQKYDFTQSQLIYQKEFKSSDEAYFTRIDNNKNIEGLKKPIVIGGYAYFFMTIARRMEYPTIAKMNSVKGNVHVCFTINENGQMTDIEIEKSLSKECDNSVLKCLNSDTFDWIPAQENGKIVKSKMHLVIKFKLSD